MNYGEIKNYDIANGGFTVGEFGAITSNKEPALVIPAQTKIPDAFTFYIAPISTPTAADGDDFFFQFILQSR